MDTTIFHRELIGLQKMIGEVKERVDAFEALFGNKYLTTRQFAVLVNRDPKTISNKVSKGDFENVKMEGGVWLIHPSELEEYGIYTNQN